MVLLLATSSLVTCVLILLGCVFVETWKEIRAAKRSVHKIELPRQSELFVFLVISQRLTSSGLNEKIAQVLQVHEDDEYDDDDNWNYHSSIIST